MTAKTRRRLVVCFVAVALTLPVETILLRAVSQSSAQAAKAWAQSQSDVQLQIVAGRIQSLPPAYRREVMRRLAPAVRSAVWRAHLYSYIAQHNSLDASSQALLYNITSLLTPQALSTPTADERTQLTILAEQGVVLLGRDDAEYLFARLGPKSLQIASGLPMGERLVEFVRSNFVVEASGEDCDCHTGFGCEWPFRCDGGRDCNIDDVWPMCGWWYNQYCDGVCVWDA